MCGIAGYLQFDGRPVDPGVLEAMIRALRHRGPDGSGIHVDRNAGLAHTRLSIIDLEGGAQPMCNEDRSLWITFNGEIFNYLELREQLLATGHTFATRSDTEVIVHLYEQYGDDFVDHLNGQFAIALWDGPRNRLILARDRVGIRPLFYQISDGRLYFASEVKSLFSVPGMERRLSRHALAEAFTFWSPLAPSTPFENVFAIPPAHIMSVDLSVGYPVFRKYWNWTFPVKQDDVRSTRALAEELRSLLIDAVRLQLRADVPVAAYLSGGLDSSIIAAAIADFTDVPLRTFSVRFEDPEFDEGVYQDAMVRQLGTNHTVVHCSRADIRRIFPGTIWHTEAPILRTAPAPLQLLSAQVRASGYKVALTGEGADEVFGGYDLFKEAKIRRFWSRDPASRLRPLLLARLYPYLKASPTSARQHAQHFFRQGFERPFSPYFGHLPRWITTQRTWRFFSDETTATLGTWDPYAAVEKILPEEFDAWAPLCRDQYIEANTLMSGYLLCSQGDRMAMANAVEGRFPYLDHRVIEFANQLPVRYKLMGLQEKFLLKRAFADLLPAAVSSRPKQPYRAPDSQSFFVKQEPADYVADLFSASRLKTAGYFSPGPTGKLFEKCRRGEAIGFADNMAFVGILSTMLLDDMFIRRPPGCDSPGPSNSHLSAQG